LRTLRGSVARDEPASPQIAQDATSAKSLRVSTDVLPS
jgi:hypothetical protein